MNSVYIVSMIQVDGGDVIVWGYTLGWLVPSEHHLKTTWVLLLTMAKPFMNTVYFCLF